MSSHFYHPSTGDLIDGGLRAARPVNGLPSPTTVLELIKGEGLIRYFQRQAWEAAMTTPRRPGSTDEEHFGDCRKWADEHSKLAREKGGDFHNLCQLFHMNAMGMESPQAVTQLPHVPKTFTPQFDAYLCWYEQYVQKTIACEQFVLGQGYAGRMDHLALLKDGRLAVVDVKTQALSGKKRAFNYYSNWALQLGAYAGALPSPADVLMSVVVSSTEPVVLEAYAWPKPPAYYHGLFLGLLAIWNEENNYWPSLPR